MSEAAIPGVFENTCRKNGALRDIRRMAGLERAAELLGGQAALAEALGVGARHVRQKIAAERPIHDDDLHLAATAVAARAREAAAHAERLAGLITGTPSE